MSNIQTNFIQYDNTELTKEQKGVLFYYFQKFNNSTPFKHSIKINGEEFIFDVKLSKNIQIAYPSNKEEIREEFFTYNVNCEEKTGFFKDKTFPFYVRKDKVNLNKDFNTTFLNELDIFFYCSEKGIVKQYERELARFKEKKEEEVKKINNENTEKQIEESNSALEWLKNKQEKRNINSTHNEKMMELIRNYPYAVVNMDTTNYNNRAIRKDEVTIFEFITIENTVYAYIGFEELWQPKKAEISSRMKSLGNSII